ncbi:ankyrin repeat domain-containing protein [Pusillimonas sp. CC-YST705]|uniref:Ankyrin repeat domain-containing protein n=1 Tax=Mesopusillimonas faecipullorum TaxID=2755040 RepID=A0ABS8CAM5_9BURK|nr:ankyrin repeat domain-containing protein [Mesopusillimonas faecipullorum]MCB5363090.1 ankyrin repeat domain-containing protein [Mesopusillimonas faecipullorum]
MQNSIGFRRFATWLLLLGLSLSLMGAASAPKDWWIALTNDHASDVREGLRRGVDPNAVTAEGMPAIMQAVREDSWKSFDLLLAHRKIDVNVTNKIDETPLMYVAVVGQTQRAAQLIAKGAQVNRLGWTPLHYAASTGQIDTMRMLLKHQAIVNAPGPDGTTPLMMAAYGGSEEAIRVLLAAGADITARNLESRSAVDWAKVRKHDALAAKLQDLTKRELDKRAALRRQVEGESALPATTPAQAVAAPVPAQPNPAESKPAQTEGEPPQGNSSYFDLQRFEREDGDTW